MTTVVERCHNCNKDIKLFWGTKIRGLKAFCPYCGKPIILCSLCGSVEAPLNGCSLIEWARCKDEQKREKRKIWGRFGMSGEISSEQLRVLQKGAAESRTLLMELFSAGVFVLDGETYFPEEGNEDTFGEIYLEI